MHCGYCYRYGHNKMGCPKAKAQANDPAEGDGTLSPMEQYDKYAKENPSADQWEVIRNVRSGWSYQIREAVEIQLAKRKRSRKTKVCNFCGEQGHNKRTCPKLKQTKKDLTIACRNFRRAFVAALEETGQGVGALVQGNYSVYRNGSWKEGRAVGVIQNIHLNHVKLFSLSNGGGIDFLERVHGEIFTVRWADSAIGTENKGPMVSAKNPTSTSANDLLYVGWRNQESDVIAPSTVVPLPEGWLDCTDAIFQRNLKEGFQGRKAPQWGDCNPDTTWGSGDLIRRWRDYEPDKK